MPVKPHLMLKSTHLGVIPCCLLFLYSFELTTASEDCVPASQSAVDNARRMMDHDDDIDLDNAPLVGKQPSSNPAEDAAAVRRPRKWDFFVLTVPFFGLVPRCPESVARSQLTINAS